jgi:hypothetical protein
MNYQVFIWMIVTVIHCYGSDRNFWNYSLSKTKIPICFRMLHLLTSGGTVLKHLSSILWHRRKSRPNVCNGNVRYHFRETNSVNYSWNLKITKILVIRFDSQPNVVETISKTTNTNSYTINNYNHLWHFHLNDVPRGFRHFPERWQLKLYVKLSSFHITVRYSQITQFFRAVECTEHVVK